MWGKLAWTDVTVSGSSFIGDVKFDILVIKNEELESVPIPPISSSFGSGEVLRKIKIWTSLAGWGERSMSNSYFLFLFSQGQFGYTWSSVTGKAGVVP